MAFKKLNVAAHMTKFNSAVSSDFLDLYTNAWESEIRSENDAPKHQTFAPSQMRCDRISWFRLRGVQPDVVKTPDRTFSFTADIGTACHELIQSRLQTVLQEKWVSVRDYVRDNPEKFIDYDMDIETKGYESMINLRHPYPVRFACDGLINFQDKLYLLEIKTSEFASWNDLMAPKPRHLDQIKTYSMLLQIPNVLFLYQDRMYGGLKCFEVNISPFDTEEIKKRMDHVMECVDTMIAPDGLAPGDSDCTPSKCPYYEKCKSWGR